MTTPLDRLFAPAVTSLGLRAERGRVLASNVANADTPGYKARDFDFSATLARRLGGQAPIGLARTAAGHLSGSGAAAGATALQYRMPQQSSIDGNTVEMDTELGAFTDNALRFEADLSFLSAQMRLMSNAITG